MMEYERFTKRTDMGNPYYDNGDKIDWLYRLAELEDKIDQGTLKEIPENAVVLTREEYEELDKCRWNNEKVADILLRFEKVEARIRKETAEKFAERVNQDINAYRKKVGEDEYVVDARRLIFEVNEICKEITKKGVQNGN